MSAAVIMMAKTGRLTLTSASFIDVLLRDGHDPRRTATTAVGACTAPVGLVTARPVPTLVPVASWLRLLVARISSPFSPSTISTTLALARAERHLLLPRLAVLDDDTPSTTPASVDTASSGAASTFSSTRVSTVPLAKKPGFSMRSPLSTRISTGKVRVA